MPIVLGKLYFQASSAVRIEEDEPEEDEEQEEEVEDNEEENAEKENPEQSNSFYSSYNEAMQGDGKVHFSVFLGTLQVWERQGDFKFNTEGYYTITQGYYNVCLYHTPLRKISRKNDALY